MSNEKDDTFYFSFDEAMEDILRREKIAKEAEERAIKEDQYNSPQRQYIRKYTERYRNRVYYK